MRIRAPCLLRSSEAGHPCSRPDWPVLNLNLRHGKVPHVCRCERGADADGGSRDETIGLVERNATLRERLSPGSGANSLRYTEGCEAQAVEQAPRAGLLFLAQPPPELLDRDRAYPGFGARAPKTSHPIRRRAAAQGVDQHCRIEEQSGHRQPDRWASPRRCSRTHAAGSSSQSCPVSGMLPRAASISSQRRSSSRPRAMSSETKALRRREPARRSSSATSSSSNMMCIRMGLT